MFDVVCSVADMMPYEPCVDCGKTSPKVIVEGHGGIQRTAPTWLKDVNTFFRDESGFKPVSDIQELRQFYRDHPTIRPAESHPALPSPLGSDVKKATEADIKRAKRARSDKAQRLIREKRSLTINSRTSL